MHIDSNQTEGLTPEEVALLETAVAEGYFKVPRETTLVQIAEQHGVSDVEASRMLRESVDMVLRETTVERHRE